MIKYLVMQIIMGKLKLENVPKKMQEEVRIELKNSEIPLFEES